MDPILELLRNELLATTDYTPQAQKFVRSVPLSYMPLYQPVSDPRVAYYNPFEGIKIRRQALTDPNLAPDLIGMLRHEVLHGLDENLTKRNNLANSLGFLGTLQRTDPIRFNDLISFLRNRPYPYPENPPIQDLEAFAQYGGPNEKYSLSLIAPILNPAADKYYRNIYSTMRGGL